MVLFLLQELPLAEAKIPRIDSPQLFSDSLDSSQGHPRTAAPQHAFHVIKKYKVGHSALHDVCDCWVPLLSPIHNHSIVTVAASCAHGLAE
jgi:hypothetical protein